MLPVVGGKRDFWNRRCVDFFQCVGELFSLRILLKNEIGIQFHKRNRAERLHRERLHEAQFHLPRASRMLATIWKRLGKQKRVRHFFKRRELKKMMKRLVIRELLYDILFSKQVVVQEELS